MRRWLGFGPVQPVAADFDRLPLPDASVDVVKAIARVPRDGNDKPLTPVVLKKVTIVREGQPLPPAPVATPKP